MYAEKNKSKLPPIVEQVVARILHARGSLFSRPGHEAADGLVRQQLLRGGEVLRKCRGVVRTVHCAVAGAADGNGAVQHRVGVALLSVALVRAPVGREGGGEEFSVRACVLSLVVWVWVSCVSMLCVDMRRPHQHVVGVCRRSSSGSM